MTKKTNEDSNLQNLFQELIRSHSPGDLLEALVVASDTSADFYSSYNEKKLEQFWRQVALVCFDGARKLHNLDQLYNESE